MATISRTGDISVVKILAGDAQLAHAAVDAVKQWNTNLTCSTESQSRSRAMISDFS